MLQERLKQHIVDIHDISENCCCCLTVTADLGPWSNWDHDDRLGYILKTRACTGVCQGKDFKILPRRKKQTVHKTWLAYNQYVSLAARLPCQQDGYKMVGQFLTVHGNLTNPIRNFGDWRACQAICKTLDRFCFCFFCQAILLNIVIFSLRCFAFTIWKTDPQGASCRFHDWKAKPMTPLVKDSNYITGLRDCAGTYEHILWRHGSKY